jgi:Cof subfamily protein (haloacid dehalogenase superfamily)
MTGKRNIRLLLSDVDGTLVTHDKVLTEATKAAVADLGRAGIAFAIASSRPPRGRRMLFEPLALQGPIAGFNGGVYVKPDLSMVRSHLLDPAAAREAVTLMRDAGLDVWVYTPDDWLIHNPEAPHVAREAWILKFDPKVVKDFSEAHLAQAAKIVGVSDDADLVAACEAKAQAALGQRASAVRSQSYYLDVTHPQANKGAVVVTLSELLSIPPEQIASIGDMPVDLPMLRAIGFSIAMGNASDAVKAEASAVTDSNEADGFAKAVRRFILGEGA